MKNWSIETKLPNKLRWLIPTITDDDSTSDKCSNKTNEWNVQINQMNKRNVKKNKDSNVPKIAIDLFFFVVAAVVGCLSCDQF